MTKGKGFAEETKTFGDTVGDLAPGTCAPLHINHSIENTRTSCCVPAVNRQGREDCHCGTTADGTPTELPKPPSAHVFYRVRLLSPHAGSIAEKTGICRVTLWQLV